MQADQNVAASPLTSKAALYVFEFDNDLLVQLGAHHSPCNLWQNLQFDKLDRKSQKSQKITEASIIPELSRNNGKMY